MVRVKEGRATHVIRIQVDAPPVDFAIFALALYSYQLALYMAHARATMCALATCCGPAPYLADSPPPTSYPRTGLDAVRQSSTCASNARTGT